MYLALMLTNVLPEGGEACPLSSSPQQMGEPSALSPHVYDPPPVILVNVVSAGGDDWSFSSLPQQTGVPSAASAHEWRPPAPMVC